jgi:hypothetical protein
MRGEVEVYCDGEVIHKETNLIMDGASELLADIMSISPSVSALGVIATDSATSAILDASNYRVAAISFGTAADSYKTNAHEYSEEKATLLSGTSGPRFRGASAVCAFIQHGGDGVDNAGNILESAVVSSYDPVAALSTSPNPAMSSLEVSSDVSAAVAEIYLSSLMPGNGQNINLIPSAYAEPLFENSTLSSFSAVAASFLGCWPEGSGQGGTEFSSFSGADGLIFDYQPSDVAYSGVYNGIFNEASSMDASGFVNMITSSVPHSGYEASSVYSGLTVSANENETGEYSWSSTGEVQYAVAIGAGDLGLANFYGGIYNMGLWTIDMKKTLQAGNTPPYSFDPLNNPRKYRLFSTKSFTNNLGYSRTVKSAGGDFYPGVDQYKDLLIKWKLFFR